jgi:hypothetical protein
MTYEQRDLGSLGTAAAPQVKFQHRYWLVPLGIILFLSLAIGVIGSFCAVPTVYIENGTETPVACMTPNMSEPISIIDPACQKALKGRYDKTWVAPGWRP